MKIILLWFLVLVVGLGCSKYQDGSDNNVDLYKTAKTSVDRTEITLPSIGLGRIWAADSCYLLFASSDEYKYCVYNYLSNDYWKIGIESEKHPLVFASYLPNNFEVSKQKVYFDILNRQDSKIARIGADISNTESRNIDFPEILKQHSLAFISEFSKNNCYFYKDSLIISTLESGMHTLNILNCASNIDNTFFSFSDRFNSDDYFFSNMHSNFSSIDGQKLIIAYRLFPRFDLINLESLERNKIYLKGMEDRLPIVKDNFPSNQNITYFSRPSIKLNRIYLPLYNQKIIDVGSFGPKMVLITDLNGKPLKNVIIEENIYLYPVFNEDRTMFALSAETENKLFIYDIN